LETIIEISDSVYTFYEATDHIDLNKYLTVKEYETGRPQYDRVTLLKVVLFAFMECGYSSLRNIEKLCKTDIRFIWLLQGLSAPNFMTIDSFINNDLNRSIEEVSCEINEYIFEKEKSGHGAYLH